ncbi:MAG TPA: T9SS type A sorting domain-containing protein, partial [Candidatus Cloacimonas sp.]|nr:T9SS type A sorting domain-containing protein [Candidatus Cloacimonas sp.]
ARFIYRVECTDLSGFPLAGVSVYNSQSLGGTLINPAITNSAGIATGELYPMKTRIWVTNPITNETAFNTQFFAEPGAVIPFSVQLPVSVEDNILSVTAGKLNLYPSVINSGFNKSIRISYGTKLEGKAELVLYDLKGRYVAETIYNQDEVEWQLPKLSSGIYFVRLSHQGKALGTAKLIILK